MSMEPDFNIDNAAADIAADLGFGSNEPAVDDSPDLPDAAPDEIDVTAIHDDERSIVFGHAAAQKGTLSLVANPLSTAVVEVQTADAAAERRAFLLTLSSGQKALFNAYCSGGAGFSGGVGAAGTAQISLTLRNKPQWFSS